MGNRRSRNKCPLFLLLLCVVMGGVWVPGLADEPPAEPFFQHAEPLRFAYATEMIGVRLAVVGVLAASDELDELAEQVDKVLQEDLPLFSGSLEAHDPSLARELKVALDEVAEMVEAGKGSELKEPVQHAWDLARMAQGLLVPADLLRRPSFIAALMTELLLLEDGVAEAYEDAAEKGGMAEYPAGWAALQRVKALWEEVRPTATADVAAEAIADVEAALRKLDALFPSPEPPAAIAGDPEEAEDPAHGIVAALEGITGALLYPDRELGRVTAMVHTLAEGALVAYNDGHGRLGLERILGARFHYDQYLTDPLGVLAPETHRTINKLFGQLRLAASSEEAASLCKVLLHALDEARGTLGG